MHTQNELRSSMPRKTFYLITPLFMSLVGIGFSLIMIVIVLSPTIRALKGTESIDVGTVCILPLFAVLFFALLLFSVAAVHIRLVTSPVGIEYYQIGYCICTSWNNIAGFGSVPYGRGETFGLILHQPMLRMSKWFGWVSKSVEQQQHRGIPIDPFGIEQRNYELEQELRRYLPHFFVEE